MSTWSADFGPLDSIWLSTARQGPLPRVAADAAREALDWKIAPQHTPAEAYEEVPKRLKAALGRLVNVPGEEIILGDSASHGLHILGEGIPWREGDEVLVVDGDFPAPIYCFLPLRRRGVTLRFIRPQGACLIAADLAANLSPATRLLSLSWVDPFTGHAIDVEAIGGLCRENGVHLALDASQALGTRPLDLAMAPVDAVTCCGQKWLCGPYGTGFAWIRAELRESLVYAPTYWAAMQAGRGLGSMRHYELYDDLGAARYDLFGAGHFLQFLPWAAAVEYLLAQGIARIAAHNDGLVERLVAGLDRDKYRLASPENGAARSTIAVVSHREADRNEAIGARLRAAGVHVSTREGNLRIAPHLFNTAADIDAALAVLDTA